MIGPPLAVATVLAALAACALWIERRFAWGARIGGSLLVIAFGALLSNVRLLPAESVVYDTVAGPVTSLAIVWLLLALDLRQVRAAGTRILGAFGLAVVSTVGGVLVSALVFRGAFGEEAWKLAGVLTGTYVGGSLNFVAVGRELGLAPHLFVAATAADNLVTGAWMGITLLLPASRRCRSRPAPAAEEEGASAARRLLGPVPLAAFDLALLLALGLALLLAAGAVARAVPLPEVVWLTTLALAVGQIPAVRRLAGSVPLGLLALTLFFAVIGVRSRADQILEFGLEVLWATGLVVAIHGVLLFLMARLARLDLDTVCVASQAAIGGPSTALALAVARKRPDLAAPGLLAGLLGYASGNYLGLLMAHWVRVWP